MQFSLSILSQGLLALLVLQVAAAPVVSTGAGLQQRDPNLVDTGKKIVGDVIQAKKDYDKMNRIANKVNNLLGPRDPKLLDQGKQLVGDAIQAKKDYDRMNRMANRVNKIFGRGRNPKLVDQGKAIVDNAVQAKKDYDRMNRMYEKVNKVDKMLAARDPNIIDEAKIVG